jgi:rhamnose transport system permease protein
LQAIAAVVLGGTSVFGGRGTVGGTLLGLFFLSILQNGIRLLALPSELTGVLIGVLLLIIVGADRLRQTARVVPLESSGGRRRNLVQIRAMAVAAVVIISALVGIAIYRHHDESSQESRSQNSMSLTGRAPLGHCRDA